MNIFSNELGGVLFALEEAASFWNPNLILRTLIASIISSFTLNVGVSAFRGLKTFSNPGLFNLGEFEPLPYEYYEIPIFVLMGCFGGLLGAFWNAMNMRISVFRSKLVSLSTSDLLCFMRLHLPLLPPQICETESSQSNRSCFGGNSYRNCCLYHDVHNLRLSSTRQRSDIVSGSTVLPRQ